MKLVVYVFIFCCLTCYSNGAKILGILPSCVYSQFILGSKLMRELSARGHEVTVISPFPTKTPIKNYKDVPLDGLADYCKGRNPFDTASIPYFAKVVKLNDVGLYFTGYTFEHANVQRLLNSNATFDLVICEALNYAHMAFAHHFNASLILLSSQGPNEWTKKFLLHPLPLVYVPALFSEYSYEMDTYQRIHNIFMHVFSDIYDYVYVIPRHDDYLKKYLPDSPTLLEISSSIDLVLYNSHVSSNVLIPMLPNMIEIGGFHIETKGLPQDVQKFLDGAVDGAIYFSMGTHLKSKNFPMEKRTAFLAAFSQIKQRVLWKWEDDDIAGKSENVKVGKWLPQQDILAHPNVKLFITHCGLLSVIEAVHFGVPILGIPICSEQKINCAISKTRGMAQTLRFDDITEDILIETLNELLNNPKYTENAKFRSEIMRDQEMKPIDRATFWIDYVLRHKGAKHLQVHGIHMPWYQYYMIDLVVLDFLFVSFGISICYFAFLIFRKYRGRQKNKMKKLI